ncbi:hypothetical protein [Chryseobacterium hagamense]|uniref:hypothetical protein n=1 Tax=Chryseobacterium hagamense TaxID=395935 RepID=UPI0014798098|nr:hypothetical protein [Chryseobacterium hagamense]
MFILWDQLMTITSALVLIAAASFFRMGNSKAKKIQRKAGSRLQMATGNSLLASA